MINEIPKYILYIIISVLSLFLLKECTEEIEIVEVPVVIEVPVPSVEVEFDTIKMLTPIYIKGEKEIDSTYYQKYITLKDSVQKNSMFKDAITIREYRERIEDDTIVIDLYTKVQGYMKEYQVGYKTKPRKITLDTVIKVPVPKKSQIFVGGEIGYPYSSTETDIQAKINLYWKNKKNILYNVGIDSKKRIWVGMAFKL